MVAVLITAIAGVATLLLGWGVDRMWPDAPPSVGAIAFASGILLLLFAGGLLAVERQWVPWPSWQTIPAFLAGLIIAAVFALLYAWTTPSVDDLEPSNIRTVMRWQFYGDTRVPTEIHSENVRGWYVYWSPEAEVIYKDKDKKPTGGFRISKTWLLFLFLKRPAKYKEVIVTFSGKLPSYEVKKTTSRYIIINVKQDVPEGELEVYTKN